MSEYRYIGKDGMPILARDLEDQRDAALAKLTKAMIALKFYADLETYEQNAEPPYQNGFFAIELDEGKVARAALAEIEGEKE